MKKLQAEMQTKIAKELQTIMEKKAEVKKIQAAQEFKK